MKILTRKRTFGFTVIELMIVIVIISILAILAYPNYVNYARKAKRGEAQQLLMNWSVNMEIWRSNNPSYANADGTGPGAPAPSNDHYTFSSTQSPVAYTLTATGTGDQDNDYAKDGVTKCTLTLNQNGQKLPAPCWN